MHTNWPIVVFVVRCILGLLFTMAGYWKVFVLTPIQHAQRFFVDGFQDTWIPEWLLWALGVSIPYLELLAGVLICIGVAGAMGPDRHGTIVDSDYLRTRPSGTLVRRRWPYFYKVGHDHLFVTSPDGR